LVSDLDSGSGSERNNWLGFPGSQLKPIDSDFPVLNKNQLIRISRFSIKPIDSDFPVLNKTYWFGFPGSKYQSWFECGSYRPKTDRRSVVFPWCNRRLLPAKEDTRPTLVKYNINPRKGNEKKKTEDLKGPRPETASQKRQLIIIIIKKFPRDPRNEAFHSFYLFFYFLNFFFRSGVGWGGVVGEEGSFFIPANSLFLSNGMYQNHIRCLFILRLKLKRKISMSNFSPPPPKANPIRLKESPTLS